MSESLPMSHRGIVAYMTMEDDPDVPSHVQVSLWYSPRQDGTTVPAFTAFVRAPDPPAASPDSETNDA